MNRRQLAKQIYDAAHLEGTFTLRSGLTSSEYFDKYLFAANPAILRQVSEALTPLIPEGTEVIAGLEMGAIPIVTGLSLQSGLPAAYVRKKAKPYGTAKLAEGADIRGKRVCVIEDVITTGGQVVLSTNDLREAGAIVEHVICVIERNPEGRAKLEEIGLNVHSLFTMEELLAARYITAASDALEQQLSFLIEIDKLKTIERKTRIMHGERLENDAEHSWHLAMMALVLSEHANEAVDLTRVFKMLLIHDIVEIDAGDTFAYDTAGHEDKEQRETLAANRIYGLLPADQGKELMELWLEFEAKETAEAKFAASLDRLQPLIHNYRNEGHTWKKYGIKRSQVIAKNEQISRGSEQLWTFAQQLIADSVAKGYLQEDE